MTPERPADSALGLPGNQSVLAGQIVNSYQVVKQLGAGGMGLVYQAVDTRLGRHVALKFLPSELNLDEDARRALMNEARAASALDHPNIGSIYGIEETPHGELFIVMALYEGQTLLQKMRTGPLPAAEAAAIAVQIAAGLAEAHARKIMHRDIKPSNIFLTRQGLVKIVDFGIARVTQSTSMRSGHLAGTAAYMSPEQARGRPLDSRTDLWSLGVVIYEMVSGRRAFAGDGIAATLYAIVNAPPPELKDDVPPGMQKIVYHALAKAPEDRYSSAAEMIQDLRKVSGPEGQGFDPTVTLQEIAEYSRLAAGPGSALKRRRLRRWLLILPLLVALAVLSVWMRPAAPKRAADQSYQTALDLLQHSEKPGNVDRAIFLLKDSVKADPNSALAFASLGHAYWRKSSLSNNPSLLIEAESNARHALQLNDTLARVHTVMGEIQRSQGHLELAQEQFQRALKLEPSNAEALLKLADVYDAQGRVPDAEKSYRQATELQPDAWDGYNRLGLFLKAHNRYPEAAQQFRRVIELAPDNAIGYLHLSAVLVDDGKLDEAGAQLQKALQRNLSQDVSSTVYAVLGALYCKQRHFAEAAESTRKALQFNNRDWRTWQILAVIYRWLGEDRSAVDAYRSALPLLEQAADVSPQNAVLQARLAETYAYCGDRERSESRIRAALAHAPNDASVLVACADAYAALGNRGRAVELASAATAHGLTLADIDQDPEARRFKDDPRFRLPNR